MWDHGLARVSCLVQWDARCVCHCSDRPTDENFSVSLCFIRTPLQNKGSEVRTLIGHDFSALRLNTFQLVTSESQIILNWNEIIRALSCNALVISVTWCLVIIKLDANCLKAVFFPFCVIKQEMAIILPPVLGLGNDNSVTCKRKEAFCSSFNE